MNRPNPATIADAAQHAYAGAIDAAGLYGFALHWTALRDRETGSVAELYPAPGAADVVRQGIAELGGDEVRRGRRLVASMRELADELDPDVTTRVLERLPYPQDVVDRVFGILAELGIRHDDAVRFVQAFAGAQLDPTATAIAMRDVRYPGGKPGRDELDEAAAAAGARAAALGDDEVEQP